MTRRHRYKEFVAVIVTRGEKSDIRWKTRENGSQLRGTGTVSKHNKNVDQQNGGNRVKMNVSEAQFIVNSATLQ